MRAVLDPNVVISGLISRDGSPGGILLALREGHFDAMVSPLLREELRRALAYPKLRQHSVSEEAEAALRWLSDASTLVDDQPEAPPVRSHDPGDDYLIALAAHEQAALVSGDRHLLELRGRIPVYTPREFLELIAPLSPPLP